MPVVMKVLQVEVVPERFSSQNTFGRLVGLIFLWSKPDVDGHKAVIYVL